MWNIWERARARKQRAEPNCVGNCMNHLSHPSFYITRTSHIHPLCETHTHTPTHTSNNLLLYIVCSFSFEFYLLFWDCAISNLSSGSCVNALAHSLRSFVHSFIRNAYCFESFAELPNQFERNAFPIIGLAWWRLSRVTTPNHPSIHRFASFSHISSECFVFPVYYSRGDNAEPSNTNTTIMHRNKIIRLSFLFSILSSLSVFFFGGICFFITLTCNSFLQTPSTSIHSSHSFIHSLGRNWEGSAKWNRTCFAKSNSFSNVKQTEAAEKKNFIRTRTNAVARARTLCMNCVKCVQKDSLDEATTVDSAFYSFDRIRKFRCKKRGQKTKCNRK